MGWRLWWTREKRQRGGLYIARASIHLFESTGIAAAIHSHKMSTLKSFLRLCFTIFGLCKIAAHIERSINNVNGHLQSIRCASNVQKCSRKFEHNCDCECLTVCELNFFSDAKLFARWMCLYFIVLHFYCCAIQPHTASAIVCNHKMYSSAHCREQNGAKLRI